MKNTDICLGIEKHILKYITLGKQVLCAIHDHISYSKVEYFIPSSQIIPLRTKD